MAFRPACKVEICKASSKDFIVVSYADNLLLMKFCRLVKRLNISFDGLNPLLLINAFLAHATQARAVS